MAMLRVGVGLSVVVQGLQHSLCGEIMAELAADVFPESCLIDYFLVAPPFQSSFFK